MTVTQKGTRATAAAATAKEFLQSAHKSVKNGKEVEEDDSTLDSEQRERDIADWISRPHEPPLSNKYKEAEIKEEDVGATQDSTEENSPIDKYEECCEYDQEDNRIDTRLSDEKHTK